MVTDAKLNQLKIAQNQAFQRKQDACRIQQNSWQYLTDAKEKMNCAFEAKQNAFEAQNQSWQVYRSVIECNGPRIEYLNSAQGRAYQRMKNAFGRAFSAHGSHDEVSAKTSATEGHSYKSKAQSYVAKRRRLVKECQSAKAQHEPYKQAFEIAKMFFGCTKNEFEIAKTAHEQANAKFKLAKTEFYYAAQASQTRLSEVKAGHSNRVSVSTAEAPYQYRGNACI